MSLPLAIGYPPGLSDEDRRIIVRSLATANPDARVRLVAKPITRRNWSAFVDGDALLPTQMERWTCTRKMMSDGSSAWSVDSAPIPTIEVSRDGVTWGPIARREVLDPTPKATVYTAPPGSMKIDFNEDWYAPSERRFVDETDVLGALPTTNKVEWATEPESFTLEMLNRVREAALGFQIGDRIVTVDPLDPDQRRTEYIVAGGESAYALTVRNTTAEARARWAWQRRILASLPNNPPVTAAAIRARVVGWRDEPLPLP